MGIVGETLFDALVAAGAFFVFDSQRREYEIEITDEAISMRAVCGAVCCRLLLRFDAVHLAAVMRTMWHKDVRAAMKYQHPDLEIVRAALNRTNGLSAQRTA